MTDDLWAWAADLTVEVAITAGCIFLLLLLSALLSGLNRADRGVAGAHPPTGAGRQRPGAIGGGFARQPRRPDRGDPDR